MSLSDPGMPLAGHLQAAQSALRAGDMRRAFEIAQRATAQGHEHPQLLTLATYHHLAAGQSEQAFALAVRACALAPGNIDACNAAASALLKMGRAAEAVAYFDQALALAPDDVDLLVNAAEALEQAKQLRRACALLERAFRLDPLRADAAARLAFISTNLDEMKKARAFGIAALARDPRQAFASFAVALADIADARYEDAVVRLRAVIALPRIGRIVRALAQKIVGDALDAMGRHDEAYVAYAQGGEGLRALYAPPADSPFESSLARSRRIAAYVSRAPATGWVARRGAVAPGCSHVFLVGFPRSGTTLLTHVLGAHPEIAVLDEPRTLADSTELAASDAGLDRLAAMADDELDARRAAYWRRAAEGGFGGGERILIEKMPLHCEILCLIAKLFPEAKVLFALRDPRDVVFSCFRRRFDVSSQTYELLTLESAAAYYDATMALSQIYRGKLALPFFDVRHEDLVRDFDAQIGRVCGFLGVAADAALSAHAERAKARDILTPNAGLVRQRISDKSVGQWRPYAAQMRPVMALLDPWIGKFGYEAE